MRRSTLRVIQGSRPASRSVRPEARMTRPNVPDSPAGVPDSNPRLGLPPKAVREMERLFGPDSAGQGTDDPAEFMATVGRALLAK